jgi:hypothetical protein
LAKLLVFAEVQIDLRDLLGWKIFIDRLLDFIVARRVIVVKQQNQLEYQ